MDVSRPGPADLDLAGDLKIPTNNTIYRECWSGYENAFSQAGFGFGHTATVEQGGLRFSSRVDHVRFDRSWGVTGCEVAPELGSDHRPLVARLVRRTR